MGLGGQASTGRAEIPQHEDRKPSALEVPKIVEVTAKIPRSWCDIGVQASMAPMAPHYP